VTVDLFAGLPVSDIQRVLTWYERLLGCEPAFLPNATGTVCAKVIYRDPDGNEIGFGGLPAG
jgi:hypothetical protein